MCGIVGYIGDRNAADILLDGLEKLEYRGYDSAGISIINQTGLLLIKEKGKLANLKNKVCENKPEGTLGIGHTRWATHGAPSVLNAHPHTNSKGDIAVVHNGIIENFGELKAFLQQKGYAFVSDTDTEVVPHLMDFYYKGDLMEALKHTAKKLRGSYALGAVSQKEPDKIVAVRKESPLIVGIGKNETFLASDIPAVLDKTSNVYLLNDNEFVTITKDDVSITDRCGNLINKQIYAVGYSAESAQKGGYRHFMLKEIFEQPEAIKNTLRGRIAPDLSITFDEVDKALVKDTTKLYLVACGTAYHAALVGKRAIEKLAGIPTEVEPASEFRYGNPVIDRGTTVIVISQSGETADTLAALRMAKNMNAKTIAITNVLGSSASREADFVFYTNAGPEIAVASTKAYTTQLTALYLFAIFAAEARESCPAPELARLKSELCTLPAQASHVLEADSRIKKLAKKIFKEQDVYFIGRGQDYAVALEASLKLKEVSYIHADAYFGGELKHGPIALIEPGTVVVAVATDESIYSKIDSNIKEVTARGAFTVGVLGNNSDNVACSHTITLPCIESLFSPALAIIPLQLLAYYIACNRGCDVDKPRNLAKSVTVE